MAMTSLTPLAIVACRQEIPGAYLRTGEVYLVTHIEGSYIYLRNAQRRSGTYMRASVYDRAIATGCIVALL